jgi:hypothetical protein
MKKQISITTNLLPLYGLLNNELPEGVSIISTPPREGRGGPGWDVTVNIDIQLVIDLSKIAPYVFAGWLIKNSNKLPGKHHVNINRKQIAVDDPKAIEHVANEIGENE